MEDRSKYIAGAAALVLLIAFGTAFTLETTTLSKDETTFDMNGTAINASGEEVKDLGIVTDRNFNFGRLPYQSSSKKFLNISSPGYTKLNLEARGNIADQLSYEEEMWFRGDKEVAVEFDPSEPGNYTGEVTVKTTLAKNSLGETWLNFRKSLPY